MHATCPSQRILPSPFHRDIIYTIHLTEYDYQCDHWQTFQASFTPSPQTCFHLPSSLTMSLLLTRSYWKGPIKSFWSDALRTIIRVSIILVIALYNAVLANVLFSGFSSTSTHNIIVTYVNLTMEQDLKYQRTLIGIAGRDGRNKLERPWGFCWDLVEVKAHQIAGIESDRKKKNLRRPLPADAKTPSTHLYRSTNLEEPCFDQSQSRWALLFGTHVEYVAHPTF